MSCSGKMTRTAEDEETMVTVTVDLTPRRMRPETTGGVVGVGVLMGLGLILDSTALHHGRVPTSQIGRQRIER